MKFKLMLLPLLMFSCALPIYAADKCIITHQGAGGRKMGAWVNQGNWLDPENLRFGLQSPERFMPLVSIKSPVLSKKLKFRLQTLNLENIKATDPVSQETRELGFILNTRLYADGLLVLQNGEVLSEQYWHGASAQKPRVLLDAGRSVLSLMGAMAVAQGKLSKNNSVIRYVSALNEQIGLRKLSIQRLLEANSQFEWSNQELNDWHVAGGWKPGEFDANLRLWLSQPKRWDRNLLEEATGVSGASPEGDLLAWALAESYEMPLAEVFCENVLSGLGPENPVYWLTDSQGTALSDGLALSLRDFARFGLMLVDARNNSRRSKIPNWFIETLTSTKGLRKNANTEIPGLSQGSSSGYGFVHLGGTANRVAILGPFGNSLYVDFDKRLVIAIFASYPKRSSAGMLAALEQVWETLSVASQPPPKKRK